MVHFRILGCFWFLMGVALFGTSVYYDWSRMRDGEFATALEHWGLSGALVAIGIGFFRANILARVAAGVLLLPGAVLCLMMFVMLGTTRSGQTYFFACLPFVIILLMLPYNAIVLITVRPKKQQSE